MLTRTSLDLFPEWLLSTEGSHSVADCIPQHLSPEPLEQSDFLEMAVSSQIMGTFKLRRTRDTVRASWWLLCSQLLKSLIVAIFRLGSTQLSFNSLGLGKLLYFSKFELVSWQALNFVANQYLFRNSPQNDCSSTSKDLSYYIYSDTHSTINSLSRFLGSEQPMIGRLPHQESLFGFLSTLSFRFHKWIASDL